jgi:hypothetical protein
LRPYLSGISAAAVSSSPDGKWVTYAEYPDQNLWRSRADGSDKLQLTEVDFVVDIWINSGIGDNWRCTDRYFSEVKGIPPKN